MKLEKIEKKVIAVWLIVVTVLSCYVAGMYVITKKKVDPCLSEKGTGVSLKSKKKYYKERILDRNTFVLNMPIDSTMKTNVMVDMILAPHVDKYIAEARKRGVNMERLLHLDFVAYDYILGGVIEKTLGFQAKELFQKDYIVINSHAGMKEETIEVVVFHEVTHHMSDDSFHCENEDCSLIMNPYINNITVQAINIDREKQLDILFNNLKQLQ